MNFKKLLTYAAAMTTAVMPAAIAQNPTILQGNYITNVFGNSNFVLNPNALTNVANVTNATRSTTTPLVATSEFTLNLTSGTFATWTLRAFDSGMKGQNCEARFTYRGFATATSTAQIVQNSLVVAQLVLTPTTDPRIASINFPCGDLVNATTFRIAQTTANMTTVTPNEIGGIYVGLATNMANVAQAEFVGDAEYASGTPFYFEYNGASYGSMLASQNSIGRSSTGSVSVAATTANVTPLKVTVDNPKPGNYYIVFSGRLSHDNTGVAGNCNFRMRALVNGVDPGTAPSADQTVLYGSTAGATEVSIGGNVVFSYNHTSTAPLDFELMSKLSSGGGACRARADGASTRIKFMVYRFPSSSELVVTPERQNTYASVKGVGSGSNSVTAASWTKMTSIGALTRTNFGRAKVETNNDYSITVENLPVGSYYVSFTGVFYAVSTASGARTTCQFAIADTATGGAQIAATQADATGDANLSTQIAVANTIGGVYNNTSLASRTFFLQSYRSSATGSCAVETNSNGPITMSVIPLDQPSNSALYVQGPILGAQTGAAIAAGYVGQEIVYSTQNTNYPLSSGQEAAITNADLALPPGVWEVSATFTLQKSTATFTGSDLLVYISSTGVAQSRLNNSSRQNSNWPTNFVEMAVPISPLRVRYDGSIMTFPNGSTAATNTIRVFAYLATFTGTPQYSLVFRAVRVN